MIVIWAGTEVPVDVVAARMDQSGVEFDATAVGFGIRGSALPVVTERFERKSQLSILVVRCEPSTKHSVRNCRDVSEKSSERKENLQLQSREYSVVCSSSIPAQ